MDTAKEKTHAKQVEITVTAWQTPVAELAKLANANEDAVAEAAAKGAVWRKKQGMHKLRRVRLLNDDIGVGDQLYLNYDAGVLAQQPLTPKLVSDEHNYSVWVKPAGMLSQGSKWSDHCTITETVQHIHGKPTFLIHRLDKAASGLIVVGHTKNAVKKLAELFSERKVEKHYKVSVQGEWTLPVPHTIDSPVQEKPAVTEVLKATYLSKSKTSELLVNIQTGRKHQIRHHLHSLHFPVVGDRLYDKDREHDCDLQLTANRLAFVCPFTSDEKVFVL